MISNIIKSTFGIDCKIEKTEVKDLALYMTAGREFFLVNMEGLSFLLVKVPEKDRFGAIALEKQTSKLKASMKQEVAFYFKRLTKLQREALINRHIPFISGTDQIYLPFLGVVLRNNIKATSDVSIDKMMPATQSLFLYLFYNKKEFVLKKEAADVLKLTRTSITRASKQLKDMGLIMEETCGKEIRMRLKGVGYELYRAARPYLVNPVQRKLYVDKETLTDKLLIAGESVLSNVSMLGEPKYEIFAIAKSNNLVKQLREIDIKWQEKDSIVQIELWKYNPALFAKEGMVDPISMALSLSDNDDERVQGELKKFMEEYEW